MKQELKEYLERTSKDELVKILCNNINNKEERYSDYLKEFDKDNVNERIQNVEK